MTKKILILAIFVLTWQIAVAGGVSELDRSGSFYLQPRAAYTFPSGYLASTDYNAVASSWRTGGPSFSLELGFYLSNSTISGIELDYTDLPPKQLNDPGSADDDSRVRIRRLSVFLKYQMIPRGDIRPFMKLGYGYYDIDRFSMPIPGTSPVGHRDYSLSGKPAFSGGIGIVMYISRPLSAELSFEAVYLNSVSASWNSDAGTSSTLQQNLYFFPIYVGFSWHISGG
jgi:hypothetical protein